MRINDINYNRQLHYGLSKSKNQEHTFQSRLAEKTNQDIVSISKNAQVKQNNSINVKDLSPEQIDYLKNKYGDLMYTIQGNSCYAPETKELMKELMEMGLISEEEFSNYDKPVIPFGKEVGLKIPEGMTDSNEIVTYINSKIGKNYCQPFDKEESNLIKLFQKYEKIEHSQPDLYGKLANILDEIFNTKD